MTLVTYLRRELWVLLAFVLLGAPAIAEDTTAAKPDQPPSAEAAKEQLQKAVQNPVASLISVPLQNNANFSYGSFNRTQDLLNLQPVIPFKLDDKWNLITRTIQPIVWQPYPNQNTGGEYGLGDMNPTFWLSPTKPGKLIWGVGPAVVIPTATSTITGQGKLSLGPSLVLLTQPSHWSIGAVINNVWSVAGSEHRPPVNQMLLQYFINYNLKKGWYLQMAPILTANWRASSGDVWTVPVGGGVGRIMKVVLAALAGAILAASAAVSVTRRLRGRFVQLYRQEKRSKFGLVKFLHWGPEKRTITVGQRAQVSNRKQRQVLFAEEKPMRCRFARFALLSMRSRLPAAGSFTQ